MHHSPRRMRDERVTLRYRSVHGFTLIELIVSMGLFAVLVGIAVPHLAGQDYDLWSTHSQLMADLRHTRTEAITRGDHFALLILNPGEYEIQRLRDDDGDGNWTADPMPLRERTLPDGITFGTGLGAALEFNTRGLLVDPTVAGPLTLHDAQTGNVKTVTVWPSGQVAPVEVP